MSKEITAKLPYRKDGKRLEAEFTIDFVSNKCNELYRNIYTAAEKAITAWKKVNSLWVEIGSLETEKPLGFQTLINEKEKEISDLKATAGDLGPTLQFDVAYDLVHRILSNNKVPDESFLTKEFWEECVDYYEIMKFLAVIFTKDIDLNGEKKINQADKIISSGSVDCGIDEVRRYH